jgi:hypothetical protein
MARVNPTRPQILILYLLALDVPVILVLSFLAGRGTISLYPWFLIAILLLFIVSVVVAWSLFSRGTSISTGGSGRSPVPSSLWLAAALFTPVGIVGIFNFVTKPNRGHGLQALSAIMLLGYI